VVLIRDGSGGEGRYHFRLTWDLQDPGRTGDFARGDDRPGRGGPGFVWNNTFNFRGQGRGKAEFNGFDQRLGDVNVDIDRGGRVLVTFRGERGRDVSFTGQVIGRDGPRLRADVTSSDRRARGTMVMSVGERENVNSITFEGGDSRDRMRVTWDRR